MSRKGFIDPDTILIGAMVIALLLVGIITLMYKGPTEAAPVPHSSNKTAEGMAVYFMATGDNAGAVLMMSVQ